MTGWRLGFAHGPRRLIEEMIKLQQFTFVCAPSIVQHAGVAAWDYDVSAHRRRLPPQARPHLRRAQGPLRAGQAGRGVLPVPEGAVGHGHGVRRRGDPQQPADHPRRRVQPARHALPHQLRRRRPDAGPRHRDPQSAGAMKASGACESPERVAIAEGMTGPFTHPLARPRAVAIIPAYTHSPTGTPRWTTRPATP